MTPETRILRQQQTADLMEQVASGGELAWRFALIDLAILDGQLRNRPLSDYIVQPTQEQ